MGCRVLGLCIAVGPEDGVISNIYGPFMKNIKLSDVTKVCLLLLIIIKGITSDVFANESKSIMVLGKPLKVKWVSEINQGNGTELFVTNEFEVSLRVLDVIHGDLSSKVVKVKMRAAHKGAIQEVGKIFVLLEYQYGSLSVLYWGVPNSIACIPNDADSLVRHTKHFRIYNSSTNSKCTIIN